MSSKHTYIPFKRKEMERLRGKVKAGGEQGGKVAKSQCWQDRLVLFFQCLWSQTWVWHRQAGPPLNTAFFPPLSVVAAEVRVTGKCPVSFLWWCQGSSWIMVTVISSLPLPLPNLQALRGGAMGVLAMWKQLYTSTGLKAIATTEFM